MTVAMHKYCCHAEEYFCDVYARFPTVYLVMDNSDETVVDYTDRP